VKGNHGTISFKSITPGGHSPNTAGGKTLWEKTAAGSATACPSIDTLPPRLVAMKENFEKTGRAAYVYNDRRIYDSGTYSPRLQRIDFINLIVLIIFTRPGTRCTCP
jgi:hypothetical protein